MSCWAISKNEIFSIRKTENIWSKTLISSKGTIVCSSWQTLVRIADIEFCEIPPENKKDDLSSESTKSQKGNSWGKAIIDNERAEFLRKVIKNNTELSFWHAPIPSRHYTMKTHNALIKEVTEKDIPILEYLENDPDNFVQIGATDALKIIRPQPYKPIDPAIAQKYIKTITTCHTYEKGWSPQIISTITWSIISYNGNIFFSTTNKAISKIKISGCDRYFAIQEPFWLPIVEDVYLGRTRIFDLFTLKEISIPEDAVGVSIVVKDDGNIEINFLKWASEEKMTLIYDPSEQKIIQN